MPYAREVAIPYSGQTFTVVNQFIPNTTIESSAVNQNFNDIASNGLSVVVKLNGDSTMTGQFKASNGTDALPSITFGSDTNTGFYRMGADQIGVTIGGVLQGYWKSTGWTSVLVDSGATAGPNITSFRDSSSPAASDVIGQFSLEGRDSAANQQQYAAVQGTILDATDGSEDATLDFMTANAGTVAKRAYVGQGLVVGAPTGGDKGAGTGNFEALYTQNVQLFPAFPMPGAIGLVIQNNSGTPNTQIDITASYAVMVNTSNLPFTATSVSVTINANTTGANGIDTGALGASTAYFIWLISDGTTTAGLLSLSATAPTMPVGYTYKVRVGATFTGGSSTLLRIIQKGNRGQYKVTAASTTTALPTLFTGAQGTYAVDGTIVYASVSVVGKVPSTATSIGITVTSQYNSGANTSVAVAPNTAYSGITTTNPPPIIHSLTAGSYASGVSWMTLESTNIAAAATAGGAACLVLGWIDAVNAS